MAISQKLKGETTKRYEIINTFNKGYNTSVADDQLNDSVFRDLTNFLPSTEGNITKRPGINRMGVYDLFSKLRVFSKSNFTLTVSGNTNDTNIAPATLIDINYLFDNLFALANYNYTRTETINEETKTINCLFEPKSLANLTILEDDASIIGNAENFEDILDFEKYDSLYKNNSYINFMVIFYGDYKETYDSTTLLDTHALRLIKVAVELSKTDTYNIKVRYEIRQPRRTSKDTRLTFRYENDEIIDPTIYANNYYFMNGYDAIVKITRDIKDVIVEGDAPSIEEIYKESTALYRPTAIEVSKIGFNILAENPLEYYDIQGQADAIRGVFYTLDNEPIQTLPYNKPFKINILSSGSGTMDPPKYREDNGEIDTSINPYITMTGSYNSENTIFTCEGLNVNTPNGIEIMIKKGSTEFITYAKVGTTEINDLNKISTISPLLLSSKYCKVIGNQLVLFGGHGYMFFSEFDNFYYFPNYNNIYAAETENENIVGITYFRQYYAIFTNKRIKRMTGAFGSDDFGLYPLNDYIGCTNPRTIKQIQNYIYFLSFNGLYRLKQGYLGEGTENVDQLDLPIYKSYDADSMLKGYNVQNYYALFSKNEALLYNFTNEAFYKLRTSDVSADVVGELNVHETTYSVPFQYNKLQDYLLYGIKVDNDGYMFDLCYQNFSEEKTERTDNGLTFVSTLETAALSLGSPTNTKKFKEIYLKLYNSYGKDIPLYVTIKVDDKTVISPKNYKIKYDEETSTYYYVQEIDSNKDLKGYNVLGTLELGTDPLGERTMQILKMRIGSKGRAMKLILSDGITQGNEGYSPNQNPYRFDVATIGIVYKLKKVKEG